MSKNDITVLLVEDELTLAMIIKDTLEENGQADTCTVSDCPFGHQRCGRRIRTWGKRLSEKAFRHAGTDHTYQGADGKSVQLHEDKGIQPF